MMNLFQCLSPMLFVVAISVSLDCAGSARAALVPPSGFTAPVQPSNKAPRDCPNTAVPYTGKLDFPSKFEGSDKARDDLNQKSEAEYRRRTAPISALERGLSQQVEDYLRSGRGESLACATKLLRQWSSATALMGEASTHTGKSMRKWALGSVAASYLRLKFSVSRPLDAEPALVRSVETWLGPLADRVVQEWSDQPLEKTNNHEYWAAWSVMATAVALDRRDLFDWALQRLDIAAGQIDAQGYLPNELKRDTRALFYHNYALTPLSMIAAFAKANRASINDRNRQALARLVERVVSGVDDPSAFESKTDKNQIVSDFSQASKFAWMEPYCWTFECGVDLQQRMDALRPLKSYRLGGNLTQIFHPAAAKPKSKTESESRLPSKRRLPSKPAVPEELSPWPTPMSFR